MIQFITLLLWLAVAGFAGYQAGFNQKDKALEVYATQMNERFDRMETAVTNIKHTVVTAKEEKPKLKVDLPELSFRNHNFKHNRTASARKYDTDCITDSYGQPYCYNTITMARVSPPKSNMMYAENHYR